MINIWQADFFSEELDSYTKGQKGQVKEKEGAQEQSKTETHAIKKKSQT